MQAAVPSQASVMSPMPGMPRTAAHGSNLPHILRSLGWHQGWGRRTWPRMSCASPSRMVRPPWMCSHHPHTKCRNMTLSGSGTVLAAVYRLANTRLLPGKVGTQCSVRMPAPCTIKAALMTQGQRKSTVARELHKALHKFLFCPLGCMAVTSSGDTATAPLTDYQAKPAVVFRPDSPKAWGASIQLALAQRSAPPTSACFWPPSQSSQLLR